MDGRVLQVNISPGGVPKLPVERAWVGPLGLDGDAHRHRFVHGGPHRAVALLGIEAIERVQADGHPIEPGSVGENLTTTGIELSRLPVGTRLAVGEKLVLELSGAAGPCDVIKGAFRDGKSGRISILTHPSDSRMYARVLVEGEVATGDTIEVLPPLEDSAATTHQLLDLVDDVDRTAWLAMWRAAAEAGYDVRIWDHGDAAAAASPDLPGSIFNRAYGLRQVPIALEEMLDLFRDAGTTGWFVEGGDAVAPLGAEAVESVGVHVGDTETIEPAEVEGLVIRPVQPGEESTWVETFIAGFEIQGSLATAWRSFGPILARARGNHQVLAEVDGRIVAGAAMMTHRRVAWLGAGTVLPEARGRGIQRALIAHRAATAAELGCTRVMATADVGSVSASNLIASGMPLIWRRQHYRLDAVAVPHAAHPDPVDAAADARRADG
ncbi:MAG TPA: GNAT family N-acetyltransferase [Candidatus Limnocylindrales bacterium]|nr:GNAT family N-acetyltransferase [Candidatus Limnocylindrales bacterium]